ncbi:BPI2 domain-containing protein [Meloidogyne graminicola]|uniref:BPI2 domain-containing protein n=1 Tax=Meloidogyne graminicola TaxID=189291 RepID=A0A8S9ZH14_9BILA|nr:BPI2 domain-containing protein [Meloidogyne graminicola]
MLIEQRELFATQQVPLRLEKVRIELILGPAVNADGHLRTDILQCRIVSGELLFENLFRDAANLSVFVPLVHQVTLTKLSEMICPIFVAELGPVIANRLLNSPLSTALFDHYFLNFGLTSNNFYNYYNCTFQVDQYRKFDYEISQSTIKDSEVAGYLRTECGVKEICAGTLFPALSKNFPNGVVAIKSRTSSFPTVLFQRGRGIVLVESRIDAFVNYSTQQQNRRFLSANMHARLNLQNATFLDYLFRAELAIDTFNISNVVSMVDGIDAGSIEFLVNALNELIIAEDMKRKLQDGIRMPVLLDFEQNGPGFIRFEEGQLLLGADFCFEDNCIKQEKSVLMTAESQQSLDMEANYYDIST